MKLLETLAAQAPAKETVTAASVNCHAPMGDSFAWLDDFLFRNASKLPPMRGPDAYLGGRKWTFEECPWNPDHRNGSAFLIQRADGVIQSGCHHNGCTNESWHTLRAVIEPKQPARSVERRNPTDMKAANDPAPATTLPYEPFPVEVLPAALADLVSEGAVALGCDEAQIALPVLAACSAAIGNSRRIALKASWSEPAVIWGAVVLPSGALKSPAMDLALDPIRQTQHEAIKEWERCKAEYEQERAQWESQRRSVRGTEPRPPICSRLLLDNATFEAVALRLAEQESKRGLLCAPDELATWIGGFNQYKKHGADAAGWLPIHRAGILMHDRKTDKQLLYVQRAFVSLIGTIQPGTLCRMLTAEHRLSGLAARLLLVVPPVRRRKWTEAVVDTKVLSRYAATLSGMLSMRMDGVVGDPTPLILSMTAEAKALWIAFYDQHNASEQAAEGGDLAAAWSKIEGYAARFALILHLVRVVSGGSDPQAVDAVSMAAGVTLARWFAQEAERVYSMLGGDGDVDELSTLRRLIEEKGGHITARQLARASRHYRADGAARNALCRLVEAGYAQCVEVAPGAAGGRPVTLFELVKKPLALQGGDTGDGDRTPNHVIASERYGTVTTVTRQYSAGDVTVSEDDHDWSTGNSDEAVKVPV